MKTRKIFAGMLVLAVVTGAAMAQQPSPAASTTATLGGKAVTIKYSAPSVKGRKIFNGAGALQPDGSVWRAGANNATALHTDGDITIGKVAVPAGDYTLYVQLDPKGWQLVVSKQTGQWGINRDGSTTLDTTKEVGRTPMKMSKPPALVETYKMTLASSDGKKGTLTLEWENVVASVDVAAK
ncbi:MAG: DUF2911 domain-containing protein [Candidatus Solibacter sp.]